MGTSSHGRGRARPSGPWRAVARAASLAPVVVWAWAVHRLGAGGGAGPVESLAAAGWGLGLLPVHCVPWARPRGRRRGRRIR
ncbi:hypothetical protein [Streptomyces luteireticuli]|uniref:Uncharacterized protein n=1 Tax=Streptomyces luteireticuli TaxID=173858 RepID=A0ABP3I501_9ACTN